MLFNIKNKKIFNLRKNIKIKSKENNKLDKIALNILNYKIKQLIINDKILLSNIQDLIKTFLYFKNKNDELSIICINLIYYKMKELNKKLKIIENKKINKILNKDVTLQDIYDLSYKYINNDKNDEIYTYKIIDKNKIDKNNLEESLKNNIEINKLYMFYINKNDIENIKYSLNKDNDILIKIKFKCNKLLYFNEIINKLNNDDIFKNVKHYFENELIDILTNDYEIYNLNEIKESL